MTKVAQTVRLRTTIADDAGRSSAARFAGGGEALVGSRSGIRGSEAWRLAGQRAPWWPRAGAVALLCLAGALYLWGLGGAGWGYGIYSAAVQAGTKSLKAAFFGSLDAGNFITVDKTPAHA